MDYEVKLLINIFVMTNNLKIIPNKDVAKLKEDASTTYVDASSPQLKELFLIENPQYVPASKEDAYASSDFKKFCKKKSTNTIYVYFPWNHHLVKTLSENDFFSLKTNRNQDLITKEEQAVLYNKKVAVFGMSVGSNIAFLLSQAGISKEMTIADFDELDTTNLNRIFAGVHQVGLNKTYVVARKIYEDNPFAKLNCLDEGISENKLEALLKKNELDLIIEEVDDFGFKIKSRVLAMKYKIPVLMVTDNGDGIVLHVERYDLGHNKIFGKTTDHWMKMFAGPKPTLEQMSQVIMNDIVGGVDKVDPRMLKSVKRVIKRELISWPQLGSAAVLAGVAATVFSKRILLNQNDIVDAREVIFIPEKNLGSHNG